jgi:hypothetical protein
MKRNERRHAMRCANVEGAAMRTIRGRDESADATAIAVRKVAADRPVRAAKVFGQGVVAWDRPMASADQARVVDLVRLRESADLRLEVRKGVGRWRADPTVAAVGVARRPAVDHSETSRCFSYGSTMMATIC